MLFVGATVPSFHSSYLSVFCVQKPLHQDYTKTLPPGKAIRMGSPRLLDTNKCDFEQMLQEVHEASTLPAFPSFQCFLQVVAQRITECTTAEARSEDVDYSACLHVLETYFDVDVNACQAILERIRLVYDCTPKLDLRALSEETLKAIILESGSGVSIPDTQIEEAHMNAVKAAVRTFSLSRGYGDIRYVLNGAGFNGDALLEAAKYLVQFIHVTPKVLFVSQKPLRCH